MSERPTPPIKLPAGWLFACLLFWGVATDQAMSALICAVVLELSSVIAFRWALTTRHYERLADLSSVGFAVLAVYAFTTYRVLGIYQILAAFPWVLLPLTLAQVYGTDERLPRSAFVMSLRKHPVAQHDVDLRPVLGCACLLAASTSALAPVWYGLGVASTLLALLAANRNLRYHLARWSATVAAVLGLAGLTYLGIIRAQLVASDFIQAVIAEFGFMPADPGQTYTALGSLGRLKLSDRIRLRIATPLDTPLPIRLTEARYQHFENGIWRNRGEDLVTLDSIAQEARWVVRPDTTASRQLTITAERARELGALALPPGTFELAGADLLELQQHSLGTLVAESRPGFLRYHVKYAPSHLPASRSNDEDLLVPSPYRPLFSRIATEAGIPGRTATDTVVRIEKFFASNFRYSLVQPGYFPGRKPLAAFLLHARSGHCEYFATATTLLLRQSGIPARYVVGYLVDEYSAREHAFLARARHAHAWAETYIEGEWRVLDTTPGHWLEAEATHGFPWHWFGDTLNWLRWQLQRLQRGELALDTPALLALPCLIGWLMWRLRPLARRARATRAGRTHAAESTTLRPLFEHLARQSVRPAPGQTARDFLLQHWPWQRSSALTHVIALYYAQRYRPGGLSDAEAHALNSGIAALLVEAGRASRKPESSSA